MYGLAATCPMQSEASVFSSDFWGYVLHGCPTVTPIGVPGAPTGTALTLPPSSEVDAQATVDAQLALQLAAQKAANAANVQSNWWDQLASGIVDTGNAAGDALNPTIGGVSVWVWVAGGIGLLAVVAVGSGSPRRYGR